MSATPSPSPDGVDKAVHLASDRDPLIVLAPLRGLTDAIFRRVYARHFTGVDLAVAPFVVAAGGRISDKLLADLLPAANRGMPVVPQILGNDPEAFLDMAFRLAEIGYGSVNWNLGCPFPMVAKKCRGSGMLPHPDRIEAFLERVMPDLPLALSIKTRLGRWDKGELLRLLPVFGRFPLDTVVIHPRTGTQMYEGAVDLEAFSACLADIRVPVVYNGDIRCRADHRRLVKRFSGVTGWMLGRGVIADPLLPARIRGLALPADPAGVLRAFHHDLCEAYARRLSGPGHLLDRMKGFWRYLSGSFADREGVWRRVRRLRRFDDYDRTVARVFDAEPLKQPETAPGVSRRTGTKSGPGP